MDRRLARNASRLMVSWLAIAGCGCGVGILSGCSRTATVPAVRVTANSHAANEHTTTGALALSAGQATHACPSQIAPQPLHLDGTTPVGDLVDSQVVCTAYPAAQGSDSDDAPRVRLAQTPPLPLPSDGPDLGAAQPPSHPQSKNSTGTSQAAIVPLPPIAAAPGSPSAPPIAPPVAPATVAGSVAGNVAPAAAPAAALPVRNDELNAVVRQADAQTARGFQLGRRGAIYSARAEFVAAMHTIAEALDSSSGDNTHERKLAAGLQALDEADDFAPQDLGVASEGDLSRIVASHQTPVLKDVPLAGVSCSAAMSRYLTFAQEQLATCCDGIPAGSAALYGMGKIYRVPESMHGPADRTHGAKSVALYQAALLVDSRNYRAANELGVLLAKFGRLPEAQTALLHSVRVSPQQTTWENLSAVHQALGERDLAERAHHEAMLAAARQKSGTAGQSIAVEWLDPATFATTMPVNIDGTPPARAAQPNTLTAGATTPAIR